MAIVKTCSVDGCEKEVRRTGLCGMHYARLRRKGSTGNAEPQHSVSNAGKICKVDNCKNSVRSVGFCNSHYKRFRRYGSPTGQPRRMSAVERFQSKLEKTENCWEWHGTKYKNDYGKFVVNKKQFLAHRWSYEYHVGPIPDGLVIDHLCRNRGCVNPEHLEAVTNEENLFRGKGYRLINGMDNKCINGHLYTLENTYEEPSGNSIRCRTCARNRDIGRHRPSRKAA